AAVVAEAIEPKALVEAAEQDDVVLKRNIGAPAATAAAARARSAACARCSAWARTAARHARRSGAALNALAATIGLGSGGSTGSDSGERRVAGRLARPRRRLRLGRLRARQLTSLRGALGGAQPWAAARTIDATRATRTAGATRAARAAGTTRT